MTLNRFEKAAGKSFRAEATRDLALSLASFPDSVPCSPYVSYFRHECPAVKGRTRSVILEDITLASPQILVTWGGEDYEVISADEAEAAVAAGHPVEAEVILAGKFTFSWVRGKCGKCGLVVMSREGVFRDARPDKGEAQADLASLTGVNKLVVRKGEMP